MGFWNDLYQLLRRSCYVTKIIMGLPLVGEINDRFLIQPPVLEPGNWGKNSKSPIILEILIDNNKKTLISAGKLANEYFFKDQPRIVFNVCFSCAKPCLFTGGDFANPLSHWFNVFFGFYEIDVVKDEWKRPFGFKSSNSNELEWDDLFKIGKSDWNWFSNYMYGVPEDECRKYNVLVPAPKTQILREQVTIGGKDYIEAQVEGFYVVSGYCTPQDKKKLLYNDHFFSAIWRTAFGRPKVCDSHTESFIPTKMKMRFYIRFEKGHDFDLNEEAYKTYMLGGTINMDYEGEVDNEAFLKAQMDAVKEATEKIAFCKKRNPWIKPRWKKNEESNNY